MGKVKEQLTLEGTVEDIIYVNEENYYTVAKFRPELKATGKKEKEEPIVIVGKLMGINPGETLRISGRWRRNPKFGDRFEVTSFTSRLPATVTGLKKYLASGMIKGIGPVFAARIVEHFSTDTLKVLESDIDRLLEVPGVGQKRLAIIKQAWTKQQKIRDIIIFLQANEIPCHFGVKLYKQYGDGAIDVLKSNPYQMALDIEGIGFKTADKIAAKLGIDQEAPQRIEAALLHVLGEASGEGHTYLPIEQLQSRAARLLGPSLEELYSAGKLDREHLTPALERLVNSRVVKKQQLPENKEGIFTRALFTCEAGVAEALIRLANTAKQIPPLDYQREIEEFERRYRFTFADKQRLAVEQALKGGVMVITGGPGTGKTTIVKAIIKILSNQGLRILLAAPTGRAAKRLSEATGAVATTIHRMLKYNPRQAGFTYNELNPVDAGLIIIDETSMLDIPLAYHLLKAMSPTASLIFIGDVDQLPPVGPGNFLRDLIESQLVTVVRLTEIFRQAQRSLIVRNAHRINQGKFPYYATDKQPGQRDFFFIEKKEPEEVLRIIKKLVKDRIPAKFGAHPVDDIQVLSPMHKGLLGARNLNSELQSLLNTRSEGLFRAGSVFKVGDKVMQIKNNYDREVFNGDIGVISEIDMEFQVIKIRFDDRIVEYDFTDLDEITLAYTVSVHKAQGSEYKVVVVPLHPQHYILLQRNLLYTAVTRGKQLVCIVGTKQAIAMAVKNNRLQHRYSALGQWLRHKKAPIVEEQLDFLP